jgi:hypothetical protein
MKTELVKFIRFLFGLSFILWLLLAVLELLMPGFAIYYINLNYLFVLVCGVAILSTLLPLS